ncbi:MAG TPA: 30S ribosomal protein S13 [Candidatus Diapherotrites archaeon]|uniref:Small ribosomal subunit protein uS13 n=1 Tax=Candidatus Iainarchaeum sp. TaxID=3101447 RepID=A0A7J4J1M0_9ARCH|nr:30S ribosomal protein S13 [Candidatus Diapherotrites archaeon]
MADGKDRQQVHHGRPTAPAHKDEAPMEDLRLIVRITGIDLDGKKPISRSLTKIKGIGVRMAKNIAIAFEKATGIQSESLTGKLSEDDSRKLEEIVVSPAKFGVPAWSLNRRKDFYSGSDTHLVMSDLDLSIRSDILRMTEIKSYKGLRHAWGLPVRGQRTKSTHRGKGGIVGVIRKDAMKQGGPAGPGKAGAAPPAAAAPAKGVRKNDKK